MDVEMLDTVEAAICSHWLAQVPSGGTKKVIHLQDDLQSASGLFILVEAPGSSEKDSVDYSCYAVSILEG